jgi:hypothetical protein
MNDTSLGNFAYIIIEILKILLQSYKSSSGMLSTVDLVFLQIYIHNHYDLCTFIIAQWWKPHS